MSVVITLPPALLRVLHALECAGYPAYMVGGCLRDAMRGVPPHDFDVTTAATPAQMLEVFCAAGLRTIETGLKHGTVTVLSDGEPIECTTYRIETTYSDGRHPDAVVFTDRIADDLARRDFTVNAMACRIPAAARADFDCDAPLRAVVGENAEPVDLYGGREDLAAGVLRCVGEPCRRFEEDALRILRCVRFSVQLGFSVEKATRHALRSCRDGLSRISRERCAAEWTRMLENEMPLRQGLALITEAGLWQYLLPEAGGEPTAAACDRAALLRPDAALRMAALLRSVGDVYNNKDNYEPATLARRVCTTLRLSTAMTRRTECLLEGSLTPLPTDDTALRRMMAACGEMTEDAVLLGALCAVSDDCVAAWIEQGRDRAELLSLLSPDAAETLRRCAAVRARGDALHVGDLALNGRDLAQMGYRGKQIGEMQQQLLEAVLSTPALNTPQELKRLAAQGKMRDGQ